METRMKNESLVSTLCIIMVHDYVYVSCMPITYCVFAHYLLFMFIGCCFIRDTRCIGIQGFYHK